MFRTTRRRVASALVATAMAATVITSNVGAEASSQRTDPDRPTVVVTKTVTPTVTVSTKPTEGPTDVMQALSSRDFSNVSTPSILLFVIGLITGAMTLFMELNSPETQATINELRSRILPF